MPFKRGRTKTGGRKKGVGNQPSKADRLSAARKAAGEAEIRTAKEAFQAALAGELKFTPLQVMNAVMLLRISKGDSDGALQAARDAAPYVHPKLNAAEVRIQHSQTERLDSEIAAEITALRTKLEMARALPAPATIIEAEASPVESVRSETDVGTGPENGQADDVRSASTAEQTTEEPDRPRRPYRAVPLFTD